MTMATSLDSAAPSAPGPFDPQHPGFRDGPYPYYHWYRTHDPVHGAPSTDGPARCFVTRDEDVTAGLTDNSLGREPKRAMWREDVGPIPASHRLFPNNRGTTCVPVQLQMTFTRKR